LNVLAAVLTLVRITAIGSISVNGLSKSCGRTFNDKTGTIFAHSKLKLKEWYFTI